MYLQPRITRSRSMRDSISIYGYMSEGLVDMEASKIDREVGVAEADERVTQIPIVRLRGRGVKLAPRLQKPKKIRMLMARRLRCLRDIQELICPIPGHAMVIVLDPLLLGVLQIEYQNKQTSPMDTHPIQMWTFLTATCIYCSVLGVKIHMQTQNNYYADIMNRVLLFSGALSPASLVSIFLPRILFWFLVVIWTCSLVLPKILLWWLSERIVSLTSHAVCNISILVGFIKQWWHDLLN